MIKRLLRKAFRVFYRYQTEHHGPTLYQLKDRIESVVETVEKWCRTLLPIFALLTFAIFIYDAGFNSFYAVDPSMYRLWRTLLIVIVIVYSLLFALDLRNTRSIRSRIFNLTILILGYVLQKICLTLLTGTADGQEDFVISKVVFYTGVIILFFSEASQVLQFIYKQGVNPAFLFLASFFLLIVFGAVLLLLPNATQGGIRPVDAWFTSASAVCVTGLTVVDTATKFTHIGKLIILILIQTGGLGIMTFAGLLTYLSAGSVSLKSQLALKDMLSRDRVSSVISFVMRIIVVTLFFEAIGAVVIYQTLKDTQFPSALEKVFFSIFHSVSSFCNAGFSTYTNSLYELPVRYNYSLHLVVAVLVILGGIGFPIVFNLFSYIRIVTLKAIHKVLRIPFYERYVHLLDITARLALVTTFILLIFGFVTYFLFEQEGTLKDHPTLWGKVVTSFFGSATPRTAGYNTVDMTKLTLPTIMIYLLLMWIGASPASTGGGIKTTVISLAFLNVKSILLGNERTEYSRVQIGDNSIRRAFAIILLSLIVLGVTVLALSVNEPDKELFAIAFEAFSAFGTVGLSLGITPDLSISSKILLSFVMLVGRVGTLTILYAFVTPARHLLYRYPTEEVSL